MMILEVDDWTYLTEGNTQIVLKAIKNDQSKKILRIPKSPVIYHNGSGTDTIVDRVPSGRYQHHFCYHPLPSYACCACSVPKKEKSKIAAQNSRGEVGATTATFGPVDIGDLLSAWFGRTLLTDLPAFAVGEKAAHFVSCDFLNQAYSRCLPHRPPKRVERHPHICSCRARAMPHPDAESGANTSPAAPGSAAPGYVSKVFIEPNYSQIYKLRRGSCPDKGESTGSTLCFDIKVKCGLRSCCPGVAAARTTGVCALQLPPDSDAAAQRKHMLRNYSRYQIMQFSKLGKAGGAAGYDAGWGTFSAPSEYDPLALCSGRPRLVLAALAALVENPQNNLRVLSDGVSVHGWECSDRPAYLRAVRGALHPDCDPDEDADGGDCEAAALHVLAEVLCRETVLRDLLGLQALDLLLDMEAVYARLCALVLAEKGGTVTGTAAAAAVEEQMHAFALEQAAAGGKCTTVLRAWAVVSLHIHTRLYAGCHGLESGSGDCADTDCAAALATLAGLEGCEYLLELARIAGVDAGAGVDNGAGADGAVATALSQWADGLNKAACLQLSFMWLLALTAKDVSVMASVRRLSGGVLGSGDALQTDRFCGEIHTVFDADGILRLAQEVRDSAGEVKASYSFEYCLSLVDLGLKPVSKVREKLADESALLSAAFAAMRSATASTNKIRSCDS